MRRFLLTLTAIALACAAIGSRPTIVSAQALPSTRHVTWAQPDATTAAVTGYVLQLDAAAPITYPPCTPDPLNCDVTLTITTAGPHVLTQFAQNIWGNGLTTTLNFTVIVPGKSNNVLIK